MSEMKVFKFDVDEDYAKQHNEMRQNTRSLMLSGIALFVLSVAAAILIWIFVDPDSHWHVLGSAGLGLFGVMMLVVAIAIPRAVGTTQSLYDAHPLAPAIITENQSTTVTLTALANTNVDPELPPRWALTSLVVKPIPNTSDAVGTKVPVAAVGAQRSTHEQGRWQAITPMPIAWATPDKNVIASARDAVPKAQWTVLERARKHDEKIKASKKSLTEL